MTEYCFRTPSERSFWSMNPKPNSQHPEGPPTQAVILAGGRGTRLGSLTDAMPKPMVRFHGRPFLEYLIEMLRNQGFTQLVLLLGYLPEPIQAHFGDGSRFGVDIEYSVTDVENDTGLRLKLAMSKLDPVFLMLYCDNYWPMRIDDMWRQFKRAGAPAMITAYSNDDSFTRDNLALDDNGYVTAYDKTRTAEGLQGVDIGFALLDRSVIQDLPDGNVSFEAETYSRLAREGKLQAFRTHHRYYTVGNLDRLPVTEEFLTRRPTVLLDRDGVLNQKMPQATYVTSWPEWRWLTGAQEALRLLNQAGYRTIVISNQPGVARGAMSQDDLDEIHQRMLGDAELAGGRIDAAYYCTHDWVEGCWCRKPNPGMLFQAQREHHLDLSRTIFFGDDERDGQAAKAAGCPWVQITEEYSLLSATTKLIAQNHQTGRQTG